MATDEKEPGSLTEQMETLAKLRNIFQENLSRAKVLAATYGYPIGRVSGFEPSSIEEGKVKCVCNVDVKTLDNEWAIRWICSPGNYLAAVDIKTLDVVLLKITGAWRGSVQTILGIKPQVTIPPKVSGEELATEPKIYVKPVSLIHKLEELNERPKVVTYVLDPLSPVFIPDPSVLERLMGIPERERQGVVIGVLSNVDMPLLMQPWESAPKVALKLKSLFQHVLIVGSTGAGKTSFTKNLIYELVKNHGASVLAIDSTQEIIQMLFPNRPKALKEEVSLRKILYERNSDKIEKVMVLLLLTDKYIKDNQIQSLEELGKKYWKDVLQPLAKLHDLKAEEPHIKILSESPPEIEIKINDDISCTVIPYAIDLKPDRENIEKLGIKLMQLNPFFTERVRAIIPRVFKELKEDLAKCQSLDEIGEVIRRKDGRRSGFLRQQLGIFEAMANNLIYNIFAMTEWDIFNVEIGGVQIKEVSPEYFIKEATLTVVDLYIIERMDCQNALVLYLLDQVFEWKRRMRKEGRNTPPTFIVIDEAHNRFPQRGLGRAEGEEFTKLVASKLTRIAREGRKERLGLILSTQFPRDVHGAVRSLCNTKIVFRVDKNDVEVLDIPAEYRHLVTSMDDLTALVMSPVGLRFGYVFIKVPLPITEHVDLSAMV